MGNIYIKLQGNDAFRCTIGYVGKSPPYNIIQEYSQFQDSIIYIDGSKNDARLSLVPANPQVNQPGIDLNFLKPGFILYLYRGDTMLQQFDTVGTFPLSLEKDNEYILKALPNK